MEVYWLTCSHCKENFPGYPHTATHTYCHCGMRICGGCISELLEEYEFDGDGEFSSCPSCDKGVIRDEDIIEYLLEKTGMTKAMVVFEIEHERDKDAG